MTPSIVTTGQDNIHKIIEQHYPHIEHKDALNKVKLANPHIVNLESLTVGQRLHLPENIQDEEDTGEIPAVHP